MQLMLEYLTPLGLPAVNAEDEEEEENVPLECNRKLISSYGSPDLFNKQGRQRAQATLKDFLRVQNLAAESALFPDLLHNNLHTHTRHSSLLALLGGLLLVHFLHDFQKVPQAHAEIWIFYFRLH